MPKSPEVDAWFESYEHPMRDAMMRVRELLLEADPRLGECIKWKSPTFTYEGNLASFNPRTKAHVSLMFHSGAQIPGEHPRLLRGRGHGAVHEVRVDRRRRVRARGPEAGGGRVDRVEGRREGREEGGGQEEEVNGPDLRGSLHLR